MKVPYLLVLSHAALGSSPEQRSLLFLAEHGLGIQDVSRYVVKLPAGREHLIAVAVRYKQNKITVCNFLNNKWSAAFIVRLMKIAFVFRQEVNQIIFITFYWPGSGDMALVDELRPVLGEALLVARHLLLVAVGVAFIDALHVELVPLVLAVVHFVLF